MRKVSYRLPKSLRERVREFAAKEYGRKRKSEWVCKALVDLVKADPGLTHVGLGEALVDNDVADVVSFDDQTWALLEQACLTVRRQDPLFQGVQSAVIRAALRRALSEPGT